MGRVLHATDFSRASQPAFRLAVEWARRRRAELVLLHVIAPPSVVLEDSFVTARTLQQLTGGARRDATARLERLASQAERAGVRASGRLADGVAVDGIVRAAQRLRAELVVMGTHGRTGFRRLVLGSVAERVVALAPCPVLTVRAT